MRSTDRRAGPLAWVDRFVPEGDHDVESIRRLRVAVAQAVLGFPFALVMSTLYGLGGSPTSAVVIAAVAIGLSVSPILLRRGARVVLVSNVMVATTYLAAWAVSLRTGGFDSPSVVWSFLLPIAAYAAAGRASAVVWSVLCVLQIGGLYAAESVGLPIRQELTPEGSRALALIGDLGVLGCTLALVLVLEGARQATLRLQEQASRTLDRQRILDDMHDGVGSHLLGLLVESRAGTLSPDDLVRGLETSLDDLRLIVDSLDPLHTSLEAALGVLRGRLSPRCEALSIELVWDVDPDVVSSFDSAEGMHLLRATQELVSNALRHSGTSTVEVRLGRTMTAAYGEGVALAVRDHGRGLPSGSAGRGRGMKSLMTRACKLGGQLVVESKAPGLRVAIELPTPAFRG